MDYPSIQAAIDASREADQKQTRVLQLHHGPHYLQEPIVLDHRDSGLVLEAKPNATPVVVGGTPLRNWKQQSPGRWWTDVPADSRFRMLMVNGSMAPRSRLPAEGSFPHLNTWSVPWMSTSGGGWKTKPTREQLSTLQYRKQDLLPELDLRSAEVTVVHKWDESLLTVKNHDLENGILTFHSPAGHPPGAFKVQDYYLTNVLQGMTRPGQWTLDHARHKLHYSPRPADRLDSLHVVAPRMEHILEIRGTAQDPVKHLQIRNLRFAVADSPATPAGFGAHKLGGAIELSYTEDCVLESLTVDHVAGHGIKAAKSYGLIIQNCHIHHCGAGGMKFAGEKNLIRNNLIEYPGLTSSNAIGIWGTGKGSVIDYNTVSDAPYSGIMMNGADHSISHNLVRRVMQVLEDGGGIYVTFCQNIIIRGNLVTEIEDKDASAFYLDEKSQKCVVHGNMSLGVIRPVLSHMSMENQFRNNLFISQPGMFLEFPKSETTQLKDNVFVTDHTIRISHSQALNVYDGNILDAKTFLPQPGPLGDKEWKGESGVTLTPAGPRVLNPASLKSKGLSLEWFQRKGAKRNMSAGVP